MGVVMKLVQFLVVVTAACLCVWMTTRWGAWAALGIFAVGIGVICVATAAVVHRQPIGTMTLANYVMGIVLPWGYRVGKGRLLPVVLISWGVWVLIGLSAVLATHARMQPTAATSPAVAAAAPERGVVVMTLLAVAWVVDGAVLLRCVEVFATHAHPTHIVRTLGPATLFLVAILAGSISLVSVNRSATAARVALVIAGGPPLVAALGLGFVLAVVLAAGRKTRWN